MQRHVLGPAAARYLEKMEIQCSREKHGVRGGAQATPKGYSCKVKGLY